jgi:hypothetical protein
MAKRLPSGPGTARADRRGPVSKGVASSWAAWQATDDKPSSEDFLRGVSAWMEGTTAQILRTRWTPGVKAPTFAEVHDRLGEHLRREARGPETTYLRALESARTGVLNDLRHLQR